MNVQSMISQVFNADVSSIVNPVTRYVAWTAKLLMSFVGITALIIVGIKLSVDLIFINNKPLFYKIAEAKKMCKVEGEAGIISRLGKLGSGFMNTVGNQGPVGVLTYLLAQLPDFLFFSSYILPNGEIDQAAADNATMVTWAATKLWKQIIAAVLCIFVASGLLFNVMFTVINVATSAGDFASSRAQGLADKLVKDQFGDYTEIDASDGSIGSEIIKRAIASAQAAVNSGSYTLKGNDVSNIKNLISQKYPDLIESNSIYSQLEITNSPFDEKKVSITTQTKNNDDDKSDRVAQYEKLGAAKANEGVFTFMVQLPVEPAADGKVYNSNVGAKTFYLITTIGVKLNVSKESINNTKVESSGSSGSSGSSKSKSEEDDEQSSIDVVDVEVKGGVSIEGKNIIVSGKAKAIKGREQEVIDDIKAQIAEYYEGEGSKPSSINFTITDVETDGSLSYSVQYNGDEIASIDQS